MIRRLLAAMIVVLVGTCSGATAASAHGSSDPTNYFTELVGTEGDMTGAELRVVAFGERLELERTTAHEVVVLGYSGEDYLRLDTKGVWRNANSPATYLNEDRYARVALPATASATADPDWQLVSDGATFAWHDHRAHWMSTVPPPVVEGNRDVRQVIYEDAVRLRVDGRDVTVRTRVSWAPPPPRNIWLAATMVLGGLGVVAATWRPSLARIFAIVAAAAATLSRPPGTFWLIVPVVGLGLAVFGAARRRTVFSVAGAFAGLATGALRLEVFSNHFLPGPIDPTIQRVAVAVAVGVGAAAATGLVGRRTRMTTSTASSSG